MLFDFVLYCLKLLSKNETIQIISNNNNTNNSNKIAHFTANFVTIFMS